MRIVQKIGATLSLFGLFAGVSCGSESNDPEHAARLEQAIVVTTAFRQGALPSAAYAGSNDATLRQASATANAASATTCEADGDDGSGVDKSCVLSWDVSSIPAGSTVTSASIRLRVVDGSASAYGVFELLRPWTESQVTWNLARTGAPWATPGALGAADRGASLGSVSGAVNTTQTVALNAAGVARVQAWVNDPSSNAAVVVASTSNTDGIDFASSENGTVANRPELVVTYDTGGGSGGGSGGSAGSLGGASTDPNLLVAFIGDQGANANSDAVLNLIKNEGAAAAVHNGDFDYVNNPGIWDDRVTAILGANYPYFAVIGNHDAPAWNGASGYAAKIAARHARVPSMSCTGELGVQASCKFRGLHLVVSCVGVTEFNSTRCARDSAEQVGFIRSSLANDGSLWSVCNWHKNQNDMQVGTKGNEVGWNAYRECQSAGAIVATGLEHSFSRTRALTNVGNVGAGHGATGTHALLELAPGKNFVFTSGLAGVGIRAYDAAAHDDDTWWSSYYTSDRWVKHGVRQTGAGAMGALFVRFHVNGDPRRASAYFKDVNGRLVDEFTIQAR